MPRIRVAIMGERRAVAECAPAGPSIELVPVGADEPPELVLVFGWSVDRADELEGLPAPAIVWPLPGDSLKPARLRTQDRVVAPAAGVLGAWRVMPLPVADELFAGATGDALPGRALWLTGDVRRRREYLERFDHTVELVEPPDEATVAVNLHDDEAPAFEARAARALAQGRLLVSETLDPHFGLEPGIDYLEARDLNDLFVTLENAARRPDAFRRIRIRGRRRAEWFRASRVVERLAHDLRDER